MKPTLLIPTNDAPKTDVSIHLIKLAVGVEDFAHLARLQSACTGHNAAVEQGPYPRHITRQRPRREAELLPGGSMYWVVKGVIRARQRLLALEDVIDADGIMRCALVLDTRSCTQFSHEKWRRTRNQGLGNARRAGRYPRTRALTTHMAVGSAFLESGEFVLPQRRETLKTRQVSYGLAPCG